MEGTLDVSVVIPAFNEAGSILGTIREVQSYFRSRRMSYEIIVSADGTDGTRERASEAARKDPAVSVIGGPERLGKGRGVRLGILRSKGRVAGFMDADNKTPITEFAKFEPLLSEGYDMVVGSRGLAQSRIEKPPFLYRRLGGRGFKVLLNLLLDMGGVIDTQCGFKFFRREAALSLFRRQTIDGYMFDVEIIRLALKDGLRIAQVPVRWRDDADSRLELLAGNVRNLRDVLRIRFGGAGR
jgi:dolichyl-phosphate beta-glucosyltransferase